jgi:probable rRNA maturation factor
MVEINNRTKIAADAGKLKRIAAAFMESRRKSGYELSVALVGESEMKKLNRIYRKIAAPTDVLSFSGEGKFFGEIILCPGLIKKQSQASGRSFEGELEFILVHGLLHLSGLSDETEKDRLGMIRLGEKFLRNLKGGKK